MNEEARNAAPGRLLSGAAFVTALVGLADSGYLTSKHIAGTSVPCSLVTGCESVLNSEWSEIFGLPTALYGAIAYFVTFAVAFLVFSGNTKLWNMFGLVSLTMFLFSVFFVYLQAFVIEAFCQYCLLSAITSTALFCIYLATLFVADKKT